MPLTGEEVMVRLSEGERVPDVHWPLSLQVSVELVAFFDLGANLAASFCHCFGRGQLALRD